MGYKQTGFGPICRYKKIKFENEEDQKRLDMLIEESNESYECMRHNLLFNNCHDHVSVSLNQIYYLRRNDWNTFKLILLMMFTSKFNGVKGFIATFFFSFILLITIAV